MLLSSAVLLLILTSSALPWTSISPAIVSLLATILGSAAVLFALLVSVVETSDAVIAHRSHKLRSMRLNVGLERLWLDAISVHLYNLCHLVRIEWEKLRH